jgi:hypothetical protein
MEQMRQAMLSPFHSSAIHVRLTPLYSEVPKVGPVVRNLLHVDTRDLHFETVRDGFAIARLGVMLLAAGEGDQPLGAMWHTYTLKVRPGGMENSLRNGAVFALDVPAQRPGPYQIRAAVRDEATQKVGSASQYIEIPNAKKARLALTSVVLADGNSKAPTNGPVDIAAARREFHTGSEIGYLCILESKHLLKDAEMSSLTVTVRLMHDGKEIYSGPANPAEVIQGHRVVGGVLKLTQEMKPGEYFLGVLALDNPAKPKTAAMQWTDFEVID